MKPPEGLNRTVERAVSALRAAVPGWEPGKVAGLMAALESAAADDTIADNIRAELRALANELRAWFRNPAANSRDNDGFCHAETTGGALRCYMSFFPPRRGGRQLASEDCFRELDAMQITTGINNPLIRNAVAEMQSANDIIYSVAVAEGRSPGAPTPPQIELTAPHLVKNELRLDSRWLLSKLPAMLREAREGEAIGRIRPGAAGEPGVTVRGKAIMPAPIPGLSLNLGDGLRPGVSGQVFTVTAGVPVLDNGRIEIMPLFLVEGDYAAPSPDISFRGLVVVLGNISGVKVDADELVVAGNCEKCEVHSLGDVMVGGGVVGKNAGKIFADGRVAARHVSDAEVEALGDVIVTNTITYSTVTSNSRVKVTAERGAIVGGKIAALRGIEARSIGSDFGTYTVTSVGRDFLTARRMERLREVIKLHEENLAKITALKEKLARANVDIRKLPPEKQDIYLGVLRKEARSQAELASLARRRDKLNQALSDVLEATVRIREELFPPVRVEIADAIREIEERLRGVIVYRNGKEGIVTRKAGSGENAAGPAEAEGK